MTTSRPGELSRAGESHPPSVCPKCEADLRDLEHPGFYRTLGRYDVDLDRTVAWMCPDCGHEWERR